MSLMDRRRTDAELTQRWGKYKRESNAASAVWAILLIAVLIGAYFVFKDFKRPFRIDDVRVGMSMPEVQEVLGSPKTKRVNESAWGSAESWEYPGDVALIFSTNGRLLSLTKEKKD